MARNRQDKELGALLDEVRAAGGEVVQSVRNQHLKIYSGKRLVTVISATGSDVRGLRNARAILRRAGLVSPAAVTR